MAAVVGAGAAVAGLALNVEEWLGGLLNDNRHKGKKAPHGFEKGMELAPVNAKPINSGSGKFKLSHGITWIRGPITGKCLTIDPADRNNVFEFDYYSGGYCSIKFLGGGSHHGTYVFAGNQASVKVSDKDTVGNWEKFCIRVFKLKEVEYCYICCNRDQEHWYVDREGKVRHRNRKEEGFLIDVFQLHRL